MTAKIFRLLASPLLAAVTASAPAAAADTVARHVPSPAACTKTINGMGTSMGKKADTTPDGRPIYRFVVRTNGLSYDAVCDATTGVVRDVAPRIVH